MARTVTVIASTAFLAFALGAQAPVQESAPKSALQKEEDAIIALYRKGARSRQPAPKGRLLAEEANTIRRFKESKASIVYISALADERDLRTGDLTRLPQGTGTGWVWDDRGHVVTNYHVLEVVKNGAVYEPDEVRVTLADGKTYQARVIGRSLSYDTAVLQVFAPLDDLKPLPIGTSRDLEVGQKVLAIGNPWGLDHTLSTGVVSALNRSIPTDFKTVITGLIQTDAAINPGNSGGPLLDSAGRVLGMNSYVAVSSTGIGFAIPIDTMNRIVPLLILRGQVFRPRMGFDTLIDPDATRYGVSRGAVVQVVEPGTPAARAGLKGVVMDDKHQITAIGDVIIGIDGRRVDGTADLGAYLEQQTEQKDKVTLDVVRGDKIIKVTLDLRDGGDEI